MEDEALSGKNKNALQPEIRERLLKEYLMTGYKAESKQHEIVIDSVAYKVLERREATVFYNADGNTLFDMENQRIADEYERMIKGDDDARDSGKKAFSTGSDKLLDEENKMLASVKPEHKAAMQAQFDLLFRELVELARQDPEFEKNVLLPHKSMERCMKFCSDKAMGIREPSDKEKEAARNNGVPIVTPVGSDMLLGWVREYYDMDDKEEVEKEEKRKAGEKKRKAEAEKKAEARKAAAAKKKKDQEDRKKADAAKKKTGAKPVPAGKKEMEGQVSIFDMMGV